MRRSPAMDHSGSALLVDGGTEKAVDRATKQPSRFTWPSRCGPGHNPILVRSRGVSLVAVPLPRPQRHLLRASRGLAATEELEHTALNPQRARALKRNRGLIR